jgi:DnaJ family protein C protein 8
MCERAVKALRDPEKRMVYVRVMKEGYERARYERDKTNRKRTKAGLPPLPEDSFDAEYRSTYRQIFEEIDERKRHMEKAKENSFKARAEEEERLRTMEQYRILTEEEWDKTREDRVSNWLTFQKKKGIVGSKKSNCGIRAPVYRPEARRDGN